MRMRLRLTAHGVVMLVGLLAAGCQPTLGPALRGRSVGRANASVGAARQSTRVRQQLVEQLEQVEKRILATSEAAARDKLLADRLAVVVALRNVSAADKASDKSARAPSHLPTDTPEAAAARLDEARQQILHERMVMAERRAKRKKKQALLRRVQREERFHLEEKRDEELDRLRDESARPLESPPIRDPEARKAPAAARVRFVPPPAGVMRALEGRIAQLSACMPASGGDGLSIRLRARIDQQGALRDPRFSGSSLDAQTNSCLGDVLRSVRIADHSGGSRVFSLQLYLGAP